MKKMIFGLMLLIASLGVSAATLSLTTTDPGASIDVGSGTTVAGGESFTGEGIISFSSTYSLTTDSDTDALFSLSFLNITELNSFKLEVNGAELTTWEAGGQFFASKLLELASGPYTVALSGFATLVLPDDVFQSDIQIVATPIPAAVWLFGSVLLGAFGLKRGASRRRTVAV